MRFHPRQLAQPQARGVAGQSGRAMRRFFLLCALVLVACDVNTDPPARDVSDVVEDTTALTTTTITSATDLAGINRVRGHLVIDIASGPIRLPALTLVDGDLILVGTDAAPVSGNLALTALTRIGGSLRVAHTTTASLNLPRLTEIGTHLDLSFGTWSIDLPALANVGGDVRIQDATVLGATLGALKSIGGSLALSDLSFGEDVTLSLSSLQAVARDLSIRGGAIRLSADRLLTLGGDLRVRDTAGAVDLSGLRAVTGEVRFSDTALALSLGGLRRVGDTLIFERMTQLESLSFPALDSAPRIAILESDFLSITFGTLPVVEQLLIRGNTQLGFMGLAKLQRIDGDFSLVDNGSLSFVLDALTVVGGDLHVEGNTSLNGMIPRLTDIGGTFRLVSQSTPYVPFSGLQVVGQDLVVDAIFGNEEFNDFRLGALRSVGGSLRFIHTRSIEKLSLDALTDVGSRLGDVLLIDNPALIGVNAPKLATIAGHLEARANPKLPEADLLAELADVTSGSSPILCGNLGGAPCSD